MISIVVSFLVYVLGGLTLLPSILFLCWYFYVARQTQANSATYYPSYDNDVTETNRYQIKKGWIRLEEVAMEPSVESVHASKSGIKMGSFEDLTNFFSGSPTSSSTLFYCILRRGTLFVFDNDQQRNCRLVLTVRDYTVSLYPTHGKSESELFGRTVSVCLTPRNSTIDASCTYQLSCQRPIDKEDWYFALTFASEGMLDDKYGNNGLHHNHQDSDETRRDGTFFDPMAMSALKGLLDGTSARVEAQCWNALMGRLFLGVYKTDAWRQMWHTKMKNKLDKINNYHQHPLRQLTGDHGSELCNNNKSSGKRSLMRLLPLQLQLISMGDTIPCLTNFKLLDFNADGTCLIQAQLDYTGDFLVVLRTGFHNLWRPPSSLLSPFEKKNKKKKTKKDSPSVAGAGAAPATTTTTTTTTNDPSSGTSFSSPLVLSLKLRHCSGKVIFKMKPPPTCRMWAAFETMPTMEWQVTPVVLDKQIKWSVVTHLLQTKIKELVAENLVMPNMEDFPFYDSGGLGGIFGDTRQSKKEDTDATIPPLSTTGKDADGIFDI
ncbi:hypothetical protein BCR42DRAFT_489908 [Absidia repens]|uniref:SMP-LTD domain-containing protein n=1 Tax=Absidia repens TaxID=90262 RepID=A0A1X2ILB4_9FUNG|nr:hypothetical protein BCR42DRAFT_489908 [Absidia repens]